MRESTSARKESAFLRIVLAGSLLAGTGWASPAPCLADILVPGDYATIQDAVDNAMPGDTILLGDGPFFENVVIDVENLTLRPQVGASPCLDGGFVGNTLAIYANGVTVEDLKITGGESAGIYLEYVTGAVIRRNLLIVNNIGVRGLGLESCEFRDNEAAGNGAGFSLAEGCTDNLFADNLATGSCVGFLSFANGDTYVGNEASGNDSGFEICGYDNLLKGNKARDNDLGFGIGLGLYCGGGGNNTARRNEAKDNFIGFWVGGYGQTIAENTIQGGFDGVEVLSPGHDIIGNTATGCSSAGYHFSFSSGPMGTDDAINGTVVLNNKAHECRDGFAINADCVYLAENQATSCAISGFFAFGGAGNLFEANKASHNGFYGFEDSTRDGGTAGTANTYMGNRCRHNDSGPSFPAGLCSE